jgi:hypothetical protein
MRTLALAAITMVTAFGASSADAQRIGDYPGASYPVPSAQVPAYPNQGYPNQGYPNQGYPNQGYPNQGYPNQVNPGPRPQQGRPMQQRWVRDGGGRWYGGSNAPGGWNAYRQPKRGYRLPRYWIDQAFYLDDFASYGLAPPPPGYGWRRYYDDAVLTDQRGRVYDWARVDWDGGYGGAGGYAQSGYGYAQGGAGGYAQSYQQPVQQGGVTTYSTGGGYVQGGAYATGGYQVAPGTGVVTVQGAPTVTTTTTTEYVEEERTRYVAPRRYYHAPVRHYYRPAPTCGCRVAHRVWHRPARVVVEQPIQGS